MEQADVMTRLGLRSLVINADTIQDTHQRGENIWKKADTEPNMIFMAPEQLISDGFSGLVKDDTAFLCRVCLLAVDEAHILNTWGAAFRKVYRQIGWIRARLRDVVLLALTATMRDGNPIENVCEFLGLHQGRFHLIRRSNARPENAAQSMHDFARDVPDCHAHLCPERNKK
jgi:superfamily II DNA helicase RecQ